jgi:hypothetical protein
MKHWEAEISGVIFTATTLKDLAKKLDIKSSMIEGVYYRKRLENMIKIRKVVKKDESKMPKVIPGLIFVCFE